MNSDVCDARWRGRQQRTNVSFSLDIVDASFYARDVLQPFADCLRPARLSIVGSVAVNGSGGQIEWVLRSAGRGMGIGQRGLGRRTSRSDLWKNIFVSYVSGPRHRDVGNV